jgi:tetratricopeptide (TPR) repeat protein
MESLGVDPLFPQIATLVTVSRQFSAIDVPSREANMSHPSPPPAGQKLSVAIIVRDAAGLLSTTLDSIRAIADEIVVLDTGSTDDTVEVAREAGATVHQAAWQDDFSAARNECAKHVDGNWTLWLDAGETIDNLAALQLRQFVDERADVSKAYLLYVHRATAGPGISNEQIGQLRLVPTQVRLQFAGRVGESPLAAAVDAGINIDALECAIERSPNEADLQTRQAKATRNLRLVELSLADGEPNATILNVHAQALVELNRKDEAAAVYRQAIDLADRGSTAMLEAYYGLLTILDGQRDDRDTLMEFCLQALEVYPLLFAATGTARPGGAIVRTGCHARSGRPRHVASHRPGRCRRGLPKPHATAAGRGAEVARGAQISPDGTTRIGRGTAAIDRRVYQGGQGRRGDWPTRPPPRRNDRPAFAPRGGFRGSAGGDRASPGGITAAEENTRGGLPRSALFPLARNGVSTARKIRPGRVGARRVGDL